MVATAHHEGGQGPQQSTATSPTPPPPTGSSAEHSDASAGSTRFINSNAEVYLSKPFTDYTAEDYAQVVGVQPRRVLG